MHLFVHTHIHKNEILVLHSAHTHTHTHTQTHRHILYLRTQILSTTLFRLHATVQGTDCRQLFRLLFSLEKAQPNNPSTPSYWRHSGPLQLSLVIEADSLRPNLPSTGCNCRIWSTLHSPACGEKKNVLL